MAADQSVMRAVFVSEPGGPEKLLFTKSEPIPVPSDGEVLIKHSYAGVNFADVYYRQGIYRAPKGYPLILGLEAAGVVTAAEGTNTTGIRVGDRVIYLGFSGYADYSVQAASSCIKIPHGLSDEDAVGVFLMGMTALSLVQEAYPVQKGQTVLVHAAAGGLGLLLCQLIRSIGATTIGTAGGPEKCAIAEENGAHHVIDYKDLAQPRWEDQVMLLTGGEGVDVVFDTVGKDTWEGSLKVTRRRGKVVFCGSASGQIPAFDLGRLTSKNLSVCKPGLRQWIEKREELEYYGSLALRLVQNGELKLKKHKFYPITEAAQAHLDLESRKTSGKCYIKL